MNARRKATITITAAVLAILLLPGCSLIGSGENEAAENEAELSAEIETRSAEIEATAISSGNEKEQETDSSIIRGMVDECIKGNLKSSHCGWLHYQTLEQEFADYNDNLIIDNQDEMAVQLTDNNIAFITNILRSTDYEVLDERAAANTGFYILLEYDTGCSFEIRLSDSEVYLNVSRDEEYVYYTKVLNFALYEYIFRFADKNIEGFDTDIFSGIESVKIKYVKDEDRDTFHKTGKITEINITDGEMLDKIKLSFAEDAAATGSNRMAGDADIILLTDDGREYYGKITFPVDEESTDFTIVMQGYFWYECEGVYEVLAEIDGEQ